MVDACAAFEQGMENPKASAFAGHMRALLLSMGKSRRVLKRWCRARPNDPAHNVCVWCSYVLCPFGASSEEVSHSLPSVTIWYSSMWYSSWCICLAWVITVSSICIAHATVMSRRHTRKWKNNKVRPRWPKPRFRRRKLHFHLVLRCRARKGNRPERIFGKSRAELLAVRRNKRRRYRHGRSRRDALAFYKACGSRPPPSSSS